jgi:hypothetical protein
MEHKWIFVDPLDLINISEHLYDKLKQVNIIKFHF